MDTMQRYCPGCNERFAVDQDERLCPQCGHTLTSWGDAPTMDTVDSAGHEAWQSHAPPDTRDELVGAQLAQYHLEAFCGRGGMARVYRAKHLTLLRPCAVKVLSPRLAASRPETVDAFLAEARAAAGLVHPHVVTIHTIGQERGLHFIEMEYIEGRSLAHVADRAGKMDVTQATLYLVQICSALAAAHEFGLVHRDIKPANVLVTQSHVAKLADFGLAKRLLARGGEPADQALSGTPYYMAPELFRGEAADTRSDVYAMGVTYYALCTGELPFVARSLPEIARLHSEAPAPNLLERCPDAPRDAAEVIRRCLAKDPAERYTHARELYGELRAVYGGLRHLESLLSEALQGSPVTMQGEGDRFAIRVALRNGRTQRVLVEACGGAAVAAQIVRVYSVCAPIAACYFQRALELNARMAHGAVAIEPVDGQPHFVIVNAHPRATCDPEELRQSILAVATHADDVERYLTGADKH